MGGRRREKIREIFEWTMATVPATMLKAAAAAPHNLELRIDGGPLLLVAHANALNLDDLIWSDTGEDELERLIGTPSPGLLVVGHIHAPLEMYVGQTHVVRAGSVGLKYERHWFDIAHWADVAWNADSGEWAATARAVTWDFRAEIKAAYAARYPGTDILPGYEDR
ncbi:MAG: hypothetical protein FJ029_09735 [Actinobacteria bacterium]|nr:hypothetical protein [Actinomycetota bacterium]